MAILYLWLIAILVGCVSDEVKEKPQQVLPPAPKDGYVGLVDGHFDLNGEPWFPLMLNYKVDLRQQGDSMAFIPATYYNGGTLSEHFSIIASWGFNSIRICMDVMDETSDTASVYQAALRMVREAGNAGLRVMLLIKPPFSDYWHEFAIGLLKRMSAQPVVWAYDFMNEPLYFDPLPDRDKFDAVTLAATWHQMARQFAPHQLFTIALAEPIEVFVWDPSLLPVDFVEMHTYHPLRVASEMYWYGHYCGKPWMVGETSLPADNDSVSYDWQSAFMRESYQCAVSNGAIGYGWWEFQDCLSGTNFEAWYSGLRNSAGREKPATSVVKTLRSLPRETEAVARPVNYGNMLGYSNFSISGMVVDAKSLQPVEGAVIRGWNEDWSVGQNTYSDSLGRFALISNDCCTHFQVSAPGYTTIKFNRCLSYPSVKMDSLPDRLLEYQDIDYRDFLSTDTSLLHFDSVRFRSARFTSDMGCIKLKRIMEVR
ncbi:MAG: carboxypeptidase regulatory-like domain-containing protein [Bacteroidales bacterium]|nr:carboxypeptidase regulatory-like domain-containing protein [Bacteroidales bacterium]